MGVLWSSLSKPASPADGLLIRMGAQLQPRRRTFLLLLLVAAAGTVCYYQHSRRRRRVFYVQVRTSGKTGGCENQFLKDVSKNLLKEGVSLKVEEFGETSKDHLLLLFCPIASRMGTDLENALEGLRREQKAVLVVMHYVAVENKEAYLDTRPVPHPALVQTVHTRYTLPDGIYRCELNLGAKYAVAAAIKDLAKDL